MVAATSTTSRAARPSSGPARTSSGATATPARCRWGWISRLVVTARSSVTPGACGSTSARSTPPSSVRAGTTMRSARWAWGTASSVPSRTHPSPAARGPHRRHGRRAGRGAGQGGGQDHVAGDDAGQPAGALGLRAEAGERERAQHEGGPQRHRRHRVALRLQQQAELHQAVAGAAVGLGDGQPEQVGVGQRLPQVAVDALVAGLHGGDPLGVDQAGEEAGRGLGDRQLLVGQLEVHQAPFFPSAVPAGTNTGRDSSSS